MDTMKMRRNERGCGIEEKRRRTGNKGGEGRKIRRQERGERKEKGD